MISLNLSIEGDEEARKLINDKIAQCDPHRVATKVAVPVAKHWRDHLASLPKNKHGYPSTGFWEDAARRVVGVAAYGGVLLTSDKLGLRQRWHGGSIEARNHKYITIPICAEAYGTRVADWGIENLTLVILADGRKFFALWLGNGVAEKLNQLVGSKLKAYEKRMKRMEKEGRRTSVPASETITKAVNNFRTSGGVGKKPDVIILKGASGHSAARAERHMNLKFLFALKTSVEQEPNPDVIPMDLAQVAFEATVEATK